jgi:hypothetical protein
VLKFNKLCFVFPITAIKKDVNCHSQASLFLYLLVRFRGKVLTYYSPSRILWPLYQQTVLSASEQHRLTVTLVVRIATYMLYLTILFHHQVSWLYCDRFSPPSIYLSLTQKLGFDNTAIFFRLLYFWLRHTQNSGVVKSRHDCGTSRSWFENRTINIMCLEIGASGVFGILIPIYTAAYPTRPQSWWGS